MATATPPSSTEHSPFLRYTWGQNSPISRMEAELDNDNLYVVRLFPGEKAAEGSLAKIPSILNKYGFKDAYPDVKEVQSKVKNDKSEGKDYEDVLVLANVKSLDKIVHALTRTESVSGVPNIEAVNGHVKKLSDKEKKAATKVDTVKWHGRVGLVGHGSILLAGFLQKPFDIGRIINAPLGAINPILMSMLGSGKENVDVPQLMRGMREFFSEEGIVLPPMSGEELHRGFVETAKHFLAAHPIEVGSSLGVIGSGGMIMSGINGYRSGGSGASRIALGSVNIIRDAIATLVPEKKKKESDVAEMQGNWVDSVQKLPGQVVHLATHPKDIPSAAWDLIREAPLRTVGLLSLVSDALFGFDAMDAFKKNELFKSDAYELGGTHKYKTIFGKEKETVIKQGRIVKGGIANQKRAEVLEQLEKFSGIPSELRFPEDTKITADELKVYLNKEFPKATFKGDAAGIKKLNKDIKILGRLDNEANTMRLNQEMAHSWQGKITPYLGLVTAAAFLGAGILMTMSSKSHKGNDIGSDALFSRLCSVNAKILAGFPEEQREPMLHRLTGYMRFHQDKIGGKFDGDRFEKEVRSRISHMQHNPWIARVATGFPQNEAAMGVGA